MKISDLEFITNEVVPPVGGTLKYAAQVQFLYIEDKSVRKKITVDFGETLGKTEKEATEKMRAKVNKWISSQQ